MRGRRRLTLASLAVLTAAMAFGKNRFAPTAVAVRYAEGTLHGFLTLRAADGKLLAHGDLLQLPRDSNIESRLVFQFGDSSVFRETVTFTQHGVFALESYHLVQRGPAFAADLDATLSQNGDYVVTSTSHKDGREKQYTGKLDFPADLYNGMIIVVGKNLTAREARTVHVVAFTPKPMVLPLAITASGTDNVLVGGHSETAVRFTLKPKLNLLLKIGAALKGQTPPDSHLWIVTEEVPAFVRFEGPLYSGPIWRVDLTSPRWSNEK